MGEDGDDIKPDDEMFDDGCMIEPNDQRLVAFQSKLQGIGRDRRAEIRSTPMNYPKLAPFSASLKQRIDWLEKNAIRPAETIISALQSDRAPYFSNWPDTVMYKISLNADEMSKAAEDFLAYVCELKDNLEEYRDFENENAEHTVEMKHIICGDIEELFKETFPEIAITRGTYDKEQKQFVGPVIDFFRRSYWEITGQHEQLDSYLQKIKRAKK